MGLLRYPVLFGVIWISASAVIFASWLINDAALLSRVGVVNCVGPLLYFTGLNAALVTLGTCALNAVIGFSSSRTSAVVTWLTL